VGVGQTSLKHAVKLHPISLLIHAMVITSMKLTEGLLVQAVCGGAPNDEANAPSKNEERIIFLVEYGLQYDFDHLLGFCIARCGRVYACHGSELQAGEYAVQLL
jgi:hypothetical protein